MVKFSVSGFNSSSFGNISAKSNNSTSSFSTNNSSTDYTEVLSNFGNVSSSYNGANGNVETLNFNSADVSIDNENEQILYDNLSKNTYIYIKNAMKQYGKGKEREYDFLQLIDESAMVDLLNFKKKDYSSNYEVEAVDTVDTSQMSMLELNHYMNSMSNISTTSNEIVMPRCEFGSDEYLKFLEDKTEEYDNQLDALNQMIDLYKGLMESAGYDSSDYNSVSQMIQDLSDRYIQDIISAKDFFSVEDVLKYLMDNNIDPSEFLGKSREELCKLSKQDFCFLISNTLYSEMGDIISIESAIVNINKAKKELWWKSIIDCKDYKNFDPNKWKEDVIASLDKDDLGSQLSELEELVRNGVLTRNDIDELFAGYPSVPPAVKDWQFNAIQIDEPILKEMASDSEYAEFYKIYRFLIYSYNEKGVEFDQPDNNYNDIYSAMANKGLGQAYNFLESDLADYMAQYEGFKGYKEFYDSLDKNKFSKNDTKKIVDKIKKYQNSHNGNITYSELSTLLDGMSIDGVDLFQELIIKNIPDNYNVDINELEEAIKAFEWIDSDDLTNSLSTIYEGGTDGFNGYFNNLFGWIDNDSYNAFDYKTMYTAQLLSQYGVLKYEYDLSSSVGTMAPSILLSMLNPALGKLSFFASAAGGSIKNAKLNYGVTDSQAYFYGTLSGISEVTLERFLGAIPGLSEVQVTGFKSWVASAIKEGNEEFVQNYVDRGLLKLTGVDENAKVFDKDSLGDDIYTWALGASSGGLLNSPSLAMNYSTNSNNSVLMKSNTDIDSIFNDHGGYMSQSEKTSYVNDNIDIDFNSNVTQQDIEYQIKDSKPNSLNLSDQEISQISNDLKSIYDYSSKAGVSFNTALAMFYNGTKINNNGIDYTSVSENTLFNNDDLSLLISEAGLNDYTQPFDFNELSLTLHNEFDSVIGASNLDSILSSMNIVPEDQWQNVLAQHNLSGNVAGFVDHDSHLFLPASANLHTAIHENLHKISEVSGKKILYNGSQYKVTGIREFLSNGMNTDFANEVLTEYLSSKISDRKIYNSVYGKFGVKVWEKVDQLLDIVYGNNNYLLSSYASNNVSFLRSFIDSYGGVGTYDNMMTMLNITESNKTAINNYLDLIEKNILKNSANLNFGDKIRLLFGKKVDASKYSSSNFNNIGLDTNSSNTSSSFANFNLNNNDVAALIYNNEYYNTKEVVSNNLHDIFDGAFGSDAIDYVLNQINILSDNEWYNALNANNMSRNTLKFADVNGNYYFKDSNDLNFFFSLAIRKLSTLSSSYAFDSNGNQRLVEGMTEFYQNGLSSMKLNKSLADYLASKTFDLDYYNSTLEGASINRAYNELWSRLENQLNIVYPDYGGDILLNCFVNHETKFFKDIIDYYAYEGAYYDLVSCFINDDFTKAESIVSQIEQKISPTDKVGLFDKVKSIFTKKQNNNYGYQNTDELLSKFTDPLSDYEKIEKLYDALVFNEASHSRTVYSIVTSLGNNSMKKLPSVETCKNYFSKICGRKDVSVRLQKNSIQYIFDSSQLLNEQSNAFLHVCTSNFVQENNVTERLYANIDLDTLYKILPIFMNKCKAEGLGYYFKTACYNGNVYDTTQFTRDESLVIYSSKENLYKYYNIFSSCLGEVQDIEFGELPQFASTIDGVLAYGAEPRNSGKESFNSLRAKAVDKAFEYYKLWENQNSMYNFTKVQKVRQFYIFLKKSSTEFNIDPNNFAMNME